MFSDKFLGDELSEISGIWGVPWHGKITGNNLVLPDASLMAGWPQPSGEVIVSGVGTRLLEHAGYTFYQKSPTVADVVRTPEELAADTALNMQWDSYFLVRGTQALLSLSSGVYLHNKTMEGWIYFAPDGSRWQIPLLNQNWWGTNPPSSSSPTSLTIEVNPSRFGEIGVESEEYAVSITKTVAEMGQSTPAITFGTSDYLFAQTEDITPSGNKAIIALWSIANGQKAALGFLELTLTGTPGVDFSASLNVLKNREDTLGTYTYTDGRVITPIYDSFENNSVHTGQVGTPSPPACAGVRHTVNTLTVEPHVVQQDTSYMGNIEGVLNNRIVAMLYDVAGVAQPTILTIEQREEWNIPGRILTPGTPAEGDKDWINISGECRIDTSVFYNEVEGTATIEKTADLLSRITFTVTGLGGSISFSGESTLSSSSFSNRTYSVSGVTGSTDDAGTTDATTYTVEIDGVPYVTNTTTAYPSYVISSLVPASLSASSLLAYGRADNGIEVFDRFGDHGILIGQKRWSNNLIGLFYAGFEKAGSSLVETDIFSSVKYNAIHKTGVVSPFSVSASRHALYGSYNPKTGEYSIGQGSKVTWT